MSSQPVYAEIAHVCGVDFRLFCTSRVVLKPFCGTEPINSEKYTFWSL